MIDDIDRLNAAEVRQVFRLIKLNANFANTVYLVAFDKVLVVKALEEVAPGSPAEYLEKIVQVSFELPPLQENTLTEILIQNFNEILVDVSSRDFDEQRFGNMLGSGFRDFFRTLRDVTVFLIYFGLL